MKFYYFSACLFPGIHDYGNSDLITFLLAFFLGYMIIGIVMRSAGIVDFIVALGNILVAEWGENKPYRLLVVV